ncbi:nuclear transport factor 2 family protein [Streptomyces sp. MNU89]|nr:nuclear transport factor 2 family protein [Streptomyces sp. MNU89]MCC9739739.1 nuclear transport factor 2 family protein [Streptomyces sp. MNU89]
MTGMLNPSGESGSSTVARGSDPVGRSGEETGEAATRQSVREFLRRVTEGDPDRIAALYADEVDWMVAENPAVPWIKPRPTRADVAGHWADLAAHTVSGEGWATVGAIVVDGAEAVVTGELGGTVAATGKTFRSPFALRLTVENGLITRHHVYEDSLAVAAACTPDAAA